MESQNLIHGGSPLHDLFEHNQVPWSLAVAILVMLLALFYWQMFIEDHSKPENKPNKRMEEWRAKQWTGDPTKVEDSEP